jgi:hypothetical protein
MKTTSLGRLIMLQRSGTRLATLVAVTFLCAAFPAAAAAQAGIRIRSGGSYLAPAELAPRLEIRLNDDSIQSLPNDIANVIAGPDGRAWFQFHTADNFTGRAGPTLPAIKEDIAAEFAQPSPQVRCCTLCLLEPGGRAWYWVWQHATLLGYDGKTWIEHVIPVVSEGQTGYCRTRGALADGRYNLWAGSAAWFVIGSSVYRFDGANWSRQRVTPPAAAQGPVAGRARRFRPVYNQFPAPAPLLLAVSPDGQVAAAAGERGPIWICRGGKWECREDAFKAPAGASRQTDPVMGPGEDANSALISGMVLPDSANLWCLLGSGRFLRVAIGPRPKVETAAAKDIDKVQKYIGELAANDFVARERASKFLEGRGSAIRGQLQKALAASDDAEQHTRLRRLLDKLEDNPARGSPQTFGSVRLAGVQMLAGDESGAVFAVAQSIDSGRGQSGPGVAVLSPSGATKTILVDQQPAGRFQGGDWLPVILDGPGNRLWAPAGGPSGPVRRFDLAAGQAAAPFENMPIFGLCAIDSQGRVFAHQNAFHNATPVVVLRSAP